MKEALPVDAVLPELLGALRAHSAVVLEAPAGAGKTTRVPPALLDQVQGEIVVLEPRRIAARMAARRVAQELGDPDVVGWQVRFEQSGTPRTRLWYVTEGILARRMLSDPQLRGVGAVVLDEFHERHLPGDLALALAQRLLPGIKLVVMSATLEAAPLARYLGAPVIRSEGRRFPVEIEHVKRADERRLEQQVAAAVRRLTLPGSTGDVLVFLPGAAEIRRAAETCAELARHRDLLLTPLHGDLSAAEQDRALAPASRRKVILSTNVAETSVTVPGVTCVVDSGLARIASHSPWSGLPMLNVARISRASAAQRAGRAGRLGPGRTLRLYTRHDFDSRPEHHAPEIERLDLAGLLLELRAASLDPGSLPWLDPPPAAALQVAADLLRRIGALDARGDATELGRACAKLPLHPRLARLAVEAARRGYREDGCTAAALLDERDARGKATLAPTGSSDVLDLLERRRSPRAEQARAQLLRLAPPDGPRSGTRDEAILISVLAGFPDRVAKRRGADLLLASGGAAQLSTESAVRDAGLLVAVEAEERRTGNRARVLVRVASAIEPEWLLDLQPQALREQTDLVWEPARERVEVVSRLLYDQLTLEETRRLPRPDESEAAARILLDHAGAIPDLDALARLRARVAIVSRHCPESGIEALSDATLRARLEEAARGVTSLRELREADLLSSLTPADLDRFAPDQVVLPGGRKLRIEYAEGQPPSVRSRLQDFFGLQRGPSICNGRVPLTLHLLAPSGRAQQVTQDLAGFWQRHYPAIRRELMRKYPKHAWPENGATASPPSVNRRP
ncbi:MAG: ATP-dependent helicase HrpB [Deltaproteobacteria bacterium]|nr:MAG: ATP-dependent helicase HrpB [Deltaproteobacteria bacterium]